MTEWLETDGLGGFAMGTSDGIRTRRYHAILLAATQPPGGRMVLVNDTEVYIETAAGRFGLSSHRYAGDSVHPDGASRISAFASEPWPRWEWRLPDGAMVVGELLAVPGTPGAIQRWTYTGGGQARLVVRPFMSGRDFHALHHENDSFRFDPEIEGEHVSWRPYGDAVPAIHLLAHGIYRHSPAWYRKFYYAEEIARGLDAVEDLACPGAFDFDIHERPAVMAWSTQRLSRAFVDGAFAAEAARRKAYASPLHRAADQFLVARGRGKTVIAGYPWFGDWGRDTFIALRGLCLATGQRDVARAILQEWAGVVSLGMLPNRFADDGVAPEYNSVDAALWFCVAAHAVGDPDPAITAAIKAIVAGYRNGTRHGIRLDEDGLIACGEPGWQLTWMDAKVDGEVITPRIGKPVEIQALWINALEIAGEAEAAKQARTWFAVRFWDDPHHRLFDVVDCDGVRGTTDASFRPNQIFAVGGLPFAAIEGDRARMVVDTCFRELWTPAGPRSLAPNDPRYVPHYLGNPRQRDRAYHNGTVWPWLAGPFVEAWVRVYGDKAAARERFLAPLLARGLPPEICDADAPHAGVGCPFQAWSVAEALRLDRDVLA